MQDIEDSGWSVRFMTVLKDVARRQCRQAVRSQETYNRLEPPQLITLASG